MLLDRNPNACLMDSYDEVKIYPNNDERMHKLGQIRASEKSRKIYHVLTERELSAKEIGKIIDNEENPRLPNIIFHLNKMTEIGLLTSQKKLQRKGGPYLTYYKAVPVIMLVPDRHYDKAEKSKTLKSTCKRIFKFSMIGISALVSSGIYGYSVNNTSMKLPVGSSGDNTHIIIALSVVIAGLILERISSHMQKQKNKQVQ